VRQGDARGHRDHIAAEQRQFHPGLTLRHAVAHGRHAAGELRHGAGLSCSPLDERRILVEGLMRGQHVL